MRFIVRFIAPLMNAIFPFLFAVRWGKGSSNAFRRAERRRLDRPPSPYAAMLDKLLLWAAKSLSKTALSRIVHMFCLAVAVALCPIFFLRLPFDHHGPVSQLSWHRTVQVRLIGARPILHVRRQDYHVGPTDKEVSYQQKQKTETTATATRRLPVARVQGRTAENTRLPTRQIKARLNVH